MKQNKGSVVGGCMGIVFVLLGIIVVIPRAGVFGVIWTLFAMIITASNFYPVLDRLSTPELHQEEEPAEKFPPDEAEVEEQLQQLRRFLDAGLITKREYEEKREEILREL